MGKSCHSKLVLHKKTFHELTVDELYKLLRVRSEVFVVEHGDKGQVPGIFGVPAIIIVQLALIVYFIITKINR